MTATGFTALPAGWYNYYAQTDERGRRRVFRNPCPGLIHIQGETEIEFKAADFEGASLLDAECDNYLGTFYGEEYEEMFGDKAPNESLQEAGN
jgi:hypothetical protein